MFIYYQLNLWCGVLLGLILTVNYNQLRTTFFGIYPSPSSLSVCLSVPMHVFLHVVCGIYLFVVCLCVFMCLVCKYIYICVCCECGACIYLYVLCVCVCVVNVACVYIYMCVLLDYINISVYCVDIY